MNELGKPGSALVESMQRNGGGILQVSLRIPDPPGRIVINLCRRQYPVAFCLEAKSSGHRPYLIISEITVTPVT
jgi:hypothetical protein